MRRKRVYAGKAGRWDERRNTSRVHAVPARAGAEVVALLRQRSGEEWYQWLRGGRVPYTAEQYASLQRERRKAAA